VEGGGVVLVVVVVVVVVVGVVVVVVGVGVGVVVVHGLFLGLHGGRAATFSHRVICAGAASTATTVPKNSTVRAIARTTRFFIPLSLLLRVVF